MNVFKVTIFLLLISNFCWAQPFTPPGMVLKKYSIINGKFAKNHHVSALLTAEYVETNFQYQAYLTYLEKRGLTDLLQKAKPNPNVFQNENLTQDEINELKRDYFSAEIFEHFPVFGLSRGQIQTYLEWKTEQLNIAYLLFKKILHQNQLTADFSLRNFLKQHPHLRKPNQLFTDFRASFKFSKISVYEASEKGTLVKKSSKRFIKWLKKNPNYAFLTYEPSEIKQEKTIFNSLKKLGIQSAYDSKLTTFFQQNSGGSMNELITEIPYKKGHSSILFANHKQRTEYLEKNEIEENTLVYFEDEIPLQGLRAVNKDKHFITVTRCLDGNPFITIRTEMTVTKKASFVKRINQ